MIAKIVPMFSEADIKKRRDMYVIKDGEPKAAGEILDAIEKNRMRKEFTDAHIEYLTRIRNNDQVFFDAHCFCPSSCMCIATRHLESFQIYVGPS